VPRPPPAHRRLKGRQLRLFISDWDGVDYLDEDYATAIAAAVNAGVDMLMVSVEWRACLAHLTRLVADGTIPMSRIDDAVRRILVVKHRYGLFERPRPADRHWSQHDCLGAAEHRAVAREAVRKSLVLLKQGSSPLTPATASRRRRNADNRGHQCGGFTVAWQGTTGNDLSTAGRRSRRNPRRCTWGDAQRRQLGR
jgi:beta-glucosidase